MRGVSWLAWFKSSRFIICVTPSYDLKSPLCLLSDCAPKIGLLRRGGVTPSLICTRLSHHSHTFHPFPHTVRVSHLSRCCCPATLSTITTATTSVLGPNVIAPSPPPPRRYTSVYLGSDPSLHQPDGWWTECVSWSPTRQFRCRGGGDGGNNEDDHDACTRPVLFRNSLPQYPLLYQHIVQYANNNHHITTAAPCVTITAVCLLTVPTGH